MKKNYEIISKATIVLLLMILAYNPGIKAQTVQTFGFINAVQYYTVPSCVGPITVQVRGPQGTAGTSTAGLGGMASGVMTVTGGQVLAIYVGGANGFNGGAQGVSPGGNGGGGTDVRLSPWTLADRVIVAGGGGGGGATNGNAPGGAGGGGSAVGTNFVGGAGGKGANGQGAPVGGTNGGTNGGGGGVGNGSNNGGAGGGGGLLSGGGGGTNSGYVTGANGALGLGGAGGGATGPGGGAGGYYGGGGASGGTNSNAGGGGGSSWTGTLTSPSFTAGAQTGDGFVSLTFNLNGNGVASSASPGIICAGSSASLSASGMNSYTWSTGSNSTNIVVTPGATASYTVQGTNSVNCVSSSVLTVTVSSGLPVLSVSSSTNLLCLGKSITLTASGALSYTWTGGVLNGQTFFPTVTTAYTVTGENGCGTTSAVTTVTVAPILVSATSSSSIICAGSPATLTAVAPATTYTWQPFNLQGAVVVVNPSVSTIYTVTVSDGTCAGTGTLVLIANPIPTITIVASSSFVCEGDAVTMTANGGVGYTWTPGNLQGNPVIVNPTAPTLYSVSGSNSVGCTSGASQIVLTIPSPTVSLAVSNTFVCSGAAVNLSAIGADTYTWSNGPVTPSITVNPTITTTYSATGTDTNSGCTNTKTITVSVFNPSVTTTGAATICSGAGATLSASGADNYNWDNGSNAPLIVVTPTVLTGYTLSATTTSNNVTCVTIHTFEVKVNPKPTVTAASSSTNICKYLTFTLSAGGASTYSWSTGHTTQFVVLSQTISSIYTYTVTGSDANGCSSKSTIQVRTTNCGTGIDESTLSNNQFSVYPNPNNGEFAVKSAAEISLKLVNVLGQEIRTFRLTELNNHEISVTDLPAGVYFIVGQSGDHQFKQKIIVNK